MNLRKLILTQNDCYKAGKKIKVKGIMVHSTGANNPYLSRYLAPDDGLIGPNKYNNHWNQPRPDGQQKCVHAFIGKLKDGSIATYQTLPWDHRGWHAGGKANDTHIGFEICEDGLTDPVYFNKVYQEAVEFCAYLCKIFNIKPEKPWLICHSEGYQLGIASNHGDVMHWFPRHGKSMDIFRADVARKLAEGFTSQTTPKPETLYRVQVGAYSQKSNADAQAARLKAKGYDTYIVVAGGLYKVQVGAYSQKANAEAMAKKLKADGFDCFITTEAGTPAGNATDPAPELKVGCKVKIKSTATKYSTGQVIPNWVKGNTYTVQKIGNGRVLLKEIVSWVNTSDIEVVG
ncbi:MAG TPA: SPOR domain-containing protein [Oculatellaceae cyanobacterium]